MRKPVAYLVAILVGGIVWFFFQNFRIEGTDSLRVIAKTEDPDAGGAVVEGDEEAEPRFSFPKLILGRSSPNASASPVSTTQTVAKTISSQPLAQKQDPNTIRVASFHLQHFGSKAADPELTMNAVARIVRMFDVIALQGIQPGGEGSIADLVLRQAQTTRTCLHRPPRSRNKMSSTHLSTTRTPSLRIEVKASTRLAIPIICFAVIR